MPPSPDGKVVLVGVAKREPGPRVPQHMLDGRAGEADVDGHRDEAGLHDAEDRHEVFRPVGGEDGHPVAAPQAPGEEGAGHRLRPFVNAAPGPRGTSRPGVDDESPIPVEREIDEIAQVPAFHELRRQGFVLGRPGLSSPRSGFRLRAGYDRIATAAPPDLDTILDAPQRTRCFDSLDSTP